MSSVQIVAIESATPEIVVALPGIQGPAGAGTYWRQGSGVPSSATGDNGDFYLNTANGDIYGPKFAGAWGSVIYNIAQGQQGPAGSTGPAGAAGPAGPTGSAGAAGIDGKSVLNGTSAPSNAVGNNGDFFINTATSVIYGPKASGTWPSGVSLIGAAGPAGAAGAAGPAGPTGATGPAGATGAAGADGVAAATTPLAYDSQTRTVSISATPQFTGVGLNASPVTGVQAVIGGSTFVLRSAVTAASNTYTLDIRVANEFVASAAIAGNVTVNLSGLTDLPSNYVWRGVFTFQYTSGTITWFAGNTGYTVKWDGGTAIVPTTGQVERIIIEVVGGVSTIEVASLRGRA